MDDRINRIRQGGVRKQRPLNMSKRWTDCDLKAIQEEVDHKVLVAGLGDAADSITYDPLDEEPEVAQLRDWTLNFSIGAEACTALLQILKRRLLPKVPPTASRLVLCVLKASSPIEAPRVPRVPEPTPPAPAAALLDDQSFQSFVFNSFARVNGEIAEIKLNTNSDYFLSQAEFSAKHGVKLPLETTEEFVEFNRKIVMDPNFHMDLCAFFKARIIDDTKVSKIITPILKIFLSKDVGMSCTTVKRVDNRTIFTATAFSQCLRKALTESRQNFAPEMSDSEFFTAVRKTLASCRTWSGYRNPTPPNPPAILPPQNLSTLLPSPGLSMMDNPFPLDCRAPLPLNFKLDPPLELPMMPPQ